MALVVGVCGDMPIQVEVTAVLEGVRLCCCISSLLLSCFVCFSRQIWKIENLVWKFI